MPSRSRRGGSKKGKAAHTTPAQSDIVLPPKLNLENIRAIAQTRNDDNNNINISNEDGVEQTKKGTAFFSTPHTQQQERSVSNPIEQSTAQDALRTSPTITTATTTSALINHTDTGDIDVQVNSTNNNNNNKRASSSSLSMSTPLSQQPAPALRHTGPVVTEEWSRSVVHPGDEHLLYQSVDSHGSIPRSARRTVHHTNVTSTSNTSSTVHHNRTPRRSNSFTHATTHSATLMSERAPRHRQASEQLAQQRQAEEERQRQRTVRITRLAPATSTTFSRDVSLVSNAQEAARNLNPSISSSVTRLALNAANTRRAESMDYATLGHSLARSTSYLRAPSECSLQEGGGVVNSNAPRAASIISTSTTANSGTNEFNNNTTISSNGVVAGQLSYTATGTSKNTNAADESITISSDVCVGETSPVVRANARQARARNAALFFTRPSFYLTEESTSVKQQVNISTDAMTSANDVKYSVSSPAASAACSPAMRTPLFVQYTGNGAVSGYRSRVEDNNSDDEMALMMRRRAELLAQLALQNSKNTNSTTSTKEQQEDQKKEHETQTKLITTTTRPSNISSSRKATATSSSPYVLPSSLRGRLNASNAPPSQRPSSRLRRLPNIALTSIAELQPSTNTQTLNNNNITTSNNSAAAAALEPVALDELLQAQPFTAVTVEKKKNVSSEPHTSPTSQVTLRLRDDAATMRLLCDPFFPLVSEENHQRLQMCEAEHHARQALALWLNGSIARATTNGNGNERESPIPDLPLTAIALDFGEDVEKKQVKASRTAQGSGDVAVHEVEESTKEEQDSTVLHSISSSTQMGQQSINKDDSANKGSTNKSPLPYSAPRPIRLSRRGRRKQQQQQRQQEEAKRTEVVAASNAPSAEHAEDATGITPTTTTTGNTLAQSSLTNSPNRPCPRMTSPNRLIVNAVMPSENTGVVQPLITSVLGYRSSTSTSSSARSTSPPLVPTLTPPHTPPKGTMSNAGNNSGGSSSTSVTGVLRHSPLKQIVQRSPPRQDDEVGEKEERAVVSELAGSVAQEVVNDNAAEAEVMRKEEGEDAVPGFLPCETTKPNVDVVSSQDAVVATTVDAAGGPVQSVTNPAVMTQKTSKSLYSAEVHEYMRHALHNAESSHGRVSQQTSCNNDEDDIELRRCYFRQLRRELHLDHARAVKNKQQNTTTEAASHSDSNNDIRVMTEMLEDGSYQQENVRYVLEVFGTAWQQPEALRSPHIIAPQGKAPDDVLVVGGRDMDEESIALPSRIRATQLLFH